MQKHYLFPKNFDQDTEQERLEKFTSQLSISPDAKGQKEKQKFKKGAISQDSLPWSLPFVKSFNEKNIVQFDTTKNEKDNEPPDADLHQGKSQNQPANERGSDLKQQDQQQSMEAEAHYTQEDLKDAHELGYNDGYEDGLKEGAQKVEEMQKTLHDEMLERLASDMAQAIDHHEMAMKKYDEDLLRLIAQIMQKFMPGLLKKHGDAEILHIIEEALQHIKGAQKMTFFLHPVHKDKLQDDITKLAARRQKDVAIDFEYDEAMAHSDVVIDWGKGRMERDNETIMKAINSTIDMIAQKSNDENPLKNEPINNGNAAEVNEDEMNGDTPTGEAQTQIKGDKINHG